MCFVFLARTELINAGCRLYNCFFNLTDGSRMWEYSCSQGNYDARAINNILRAEVEGGNGASSAAGRYCQKWRETLLWCLQSCFVFHLLLLLDIKEGHENYQLRQELFKPCSQEKKSICYQESPRIIYTVSLCRYMRDKKRSIPPSPRRRF